MHMDVGSRVQIACSIKSEILTTVTINEVPGEVTASALKMQPASPSDIFVYSYETAQVYVPEYSNVLSVIF
jgi:hypothetical protein